MEGVINILMEAENGKRSALFPHVLMCVLSVHLQSPRSRNLHYSLKQKSTNA